MEGAFFDFGLLIAKCLGHGLVSERDGGSAPAEGGDIIAETIVDFGDGFVEVCVAVVVGDLLGVVIDCDEVVAELSNGLCKFDLFPFDESIRESLVSGDVSAVELDGLDESASGGFALPGS